MIKTKTILEHKLEDRIYRFECDPTSPLGEVYDAINIFKSHVMKLITDIEKNQEETPKEEEK